MLSNKPIKDLIRPLTFFVGVLAVLIAPGLNAVPSKIPQTAAEHQAMAESYKKKAAEFRAEANYHRQMKEDYKKTVAVNLKTPTENPWIKKMGVHCDQYIQEAESLANESMKFSEYHLMRAKELQGN